MLCCIQIFYQLPRSVRIGAYYICGGNVILKGSGIAGTLCTPAPIFVMIQTFVRLFFFLCIKFQLSSSFQISARSFTCILIALVVSLSAITFNETIDSVESSSEEYEYQYFFSLAKKTASVFLVKLCLPMSSTAIDELPLRP